MNPPQQLTAINVQNEFKPMIYYNNGKQEQKKASALTFLIQGKNKKQNDKVTHKKVSSMQMKCSRSKPKTGMGLTYLD